MFLTRKAQRKIRLLTGAYFIIGAVCFSEAVYFSFWQVEIKKFIVLGILSFLFGLLYRAWGRYFEGKGKLLAQGNKLVELEMKPKAFVKLYEEKRDCPDNVISVPDFQVLQLLLVAYDSMGEVEKVFKILEQMETIAPPKKQNRLKLLKAAVLYSDGRIEEGNALYNELLATELSVTDKSLFDVVTKGDRAMALGDYATVEQYYKQRMAQTFPQNTPLAILGIHFQLARLYCITEREKEAIPYLQYCVEHGGETHMKQDAEDMLRRIYEQRSVNY